MVAGLTLGRKKYAEVADDMSGIRARLEAARADILRLVEEDSRAFEELMAARRLPEGNETEASLKAQSVLKATDRAIEAPMGVARRSAGLMDDLRQLAEKGNSNAVSDVGVAALLAQAAVIGAGYNVRINLQGHADGEKCQTYLKELKTLALRADERSKAIGRLVDGRLGSF
jgi:formiminotetrahydrofolate cyclodeaminase